MELGVGKLVIRSKSVKAAEALEPVSWALLLLLVHVELGGRADGDCHGAGVGHAVNHVHRDPGGACQEPVLLVPYSLEGRGDLNATRGS